MNTLNDTFTSNSNDYQQSQNIATHLSSMASPSQNSPMSNLNATSSTASTTTQQSQQNSSSSANSSTSILRTNNTENQNLPILTKPRLQELVREVDPTEQLDEEVEEILLQIADDFVEDTVKAACAFAKHRKVSKIEVKDVQLHLERKWNMWIPGFGTDELRPYKRATVTEAHKQRLALIRKTIKKY